MSKKAIVIGAGFSGLSAATHLAHAGVEVTVVEKNAQVGGRARTLESNGFKFDMGPSWYWMPDVFERYFNHFGKSVKDYYPLKRLDPSYKVFFGPGDAVEIPAKLEEVYALFESIEKGSSRWLKKFLKEAAYKYQVGITDLVYKPCFSIREFMQFSLLKGLLKMNVFQSFHASIRNYFKHPKLLSLLEFPVLFLGAMPKDTPALYSLMNHADIQLGTWYPMGGMHQVIEGMTTLAKSKGVIFKTGEKGEHLQVKNGKVQRFDTNKGVYQADYFVASADYHHVEQNLLDQPYRNYPESYWKKKTFAPSALIFYIGVNKKLRNLEHHNLFFDKDFEQHAIELYKEPSWPSNPLFYVSCVSKTDSTVAPEGNENLFVLIPVAPGLQDDESTREHYYEKVMDRLEERSGQQIREDVVFKKSYAHKDFIKDYHAYQGNAYGLANTLRQTAFFKPSMRNKKVTNLFYTGQLTVPGPGVPPAIISGQVAADQILQKIHQHGR